MSSSWPELTVGSLIECGVITVQKDGNHGSKYPRASEFGDTGVPFLTAKLLDDSGNIDFENAPKLAQEKADKFTFGILQPGDVLLSHNATVGRVAIVPDIKEKVVIGTSLTHYRVDPERLDPRYLAAYMSGRYFQNQLASSMSQTTRNQVPITAQRKLTVILPPIVEQRSIANSLGNLSDKIRVNYRINKTLEEMAQATFKSWFVDFEPVKAKIVARERWQARQSAQQPASPVCYAAELEPESLDPELETRMALAAMQAISGKAEAQLARLQTEHPEHYAELRATADLFPAAMQKSELGEIPEGWRVAPFSDLARLDTTSVKPAQQPEKEWEHYSIPAFDDGQTPAHEFGADIKSNKYKVNRSAVLASKLNPHFPRTWIPLVEDETAAICSTEFMPFVPLEESHRPFVAGMVTSAPFQSGIMMRVTGSTGSRQRAQPKQVAVMDVVTPPTALIAAYSKLADPLMASTARNISQSQTLAKLRDTLLPKLLSGEITVPEVDSQLDEATETAHV